MDDVTFGGHAYKCNKIFVITNNISIIVAINVLWVQTNCRVFQPCFLCNEIFVGSFSIREVSLKGINMAAMGEAHRILIAAV